MTGGGVVKTKRMQSVAGILLAAGLMLAVARTAPAETVFTPHAPNGLALTPPMGWNSWNKFGCDISEAIIRREADAMTESGMQAAGYRYVVIDDCWQGTRDGAGNIQPDPGRFPGGIKVLADYVHAKGLKFGIYSDAGAMTCEKRPGSRGHEYQDAAQYAAWGVDYLKYDFCYGEFLDARAAYETMSDALRAGARPIVFSICEWGTHQPWVWAASVGGNLWRTTGDISDIWEGAGHEPKWNGVVEILDAEADLASYAGPGHWNDPDMLEVGNGGMTAVEYRAHFSLWAMLAAPLIAGNDLSSMTAETAAILTNREVIAIDQDPLGAAAHRAGKDGDAEIWVRPLAGGAQAVALLNRGNSPRSIRLDWSALDLPDYVPLAVRDLWAAKDLARATGSLAVGVAPHAVVLLKVVPARPGRR